MGGGRPVVAAGGGRGQRGVGGAREVEERGPVEELCPGTPRRRWSGGPSYQGQTGIMAQSRSQQEIAGGQAHADPAHTPHMWVWGQPHSSLPGAPCPLWSAGDCVCPGGSLQDSGLGPFCGLLPRLLLREAVRCSRLALRVDRRAWRARGGCPHAADGSEPPHCPSTGDPRPRAVKML